MLKKISRTYKSLLCLSISLLISIVLVGCSGKSGYAKVDSITSGPASSKNKPKKAKYIPKSHKVVSGETLYSIAWKYSKNYKELARINGIKSPYVIYPGQRITIKNTPPKKKVKPKKVTKNNKVIKKKEVVSKTPKLSRADASVLKEKIRWRWPARGKLLAAFSSNARFNKGIDIAGKLGEPVYAAARGKVVFSGSGLRGYGRLVIIHHDEKFLSAYAHNSRLLVKENQVVKAGQKIAEIGSTGTDKAKLHFEIRKDGKPVDPLRYLPKR
jgi:lipoprotein NlpD